MHLLAAELPRAMSATPDPRLLGFLPATRDRHRAQRRVALLVGSAPKSCGGLDRGTRSAAPIAPPHVAARLLALEIALSFLLVTTSGLLLRTFNTSVKYRLAFPGKPARHLCGGLPRAGSRRCRSGLSSCTVDRSNARAARRCFSSADHRTARRPIRIEWRLCGSG